MGEERVEIRLTSGERVTVDGSLTDVEKRLSDASRSGPSRLAWMQQSEGGESIGINPSHVTAVVPG